MDATGKHYIKGNKPGSEIYNVTACFFLIYGEYIQIQTLYIYTHTYLYMYMYICIYRKHISKSGMVNGDEGGGKEGKNDKSE
jgi:hypothetical protein